MELCWWSCFVAIFAVSAMASRAVPWRERRDYPKDHDHFEVYVTDEALPMTGERALTDGCGRNGRPYKYRGKGHITELGRALQGVTDEVWVGAVVTTTPWVWSNGRYLFKLEGLTKSLRYTMHAVRIPGNNVFLCSLQCNQATFVLLQGNKCACSVASPEILPVSGNTFRCPGTYDDYCGTISAYSVYRNLLADTVRWSNLVERSRYYGTKAYLYRSQLNNSPAVQLMAEVNPTATKGYICNGTVLQIGGKHITHLWAEHPQRASRTWRNAQKACMNRGRQLMILSRDARTCLPEVEKELNRGQSYWVGLSRQNVSLWLDGTAVKTTVSYHQHGQSACLAMSVGSGGPTFTFESCTGIKLQVLCERDTKIHLRTFTHDAEGNHVITQKASNKNDYSSTVGILIGVLVALSILSVILVVFLCNRNKWIPRKSLSPSRRKPSHTERATGDDESGGTGTPTNDHESLRNKPNSPDNSCARDALGYAIVSKSGKQVRPPPTGSDRPSAASGAVEYTEVCFSDDSCDECKPGPTAPENRARVSPAVSPQRKSELAGRLSSLRMLDYRIDSSQSSVTGSDDAYSVLNYRKAIQRAWKGLKRSAYSHVMITSRHADGTINGPKTAGSVEAAAGIDDVNVYDVARTRKPPRGMRCIDNDYDHAEPRPDQKSRCQARNARITRIMLAHPNAGNESEV